MIMKIYALIVLAIVLSVKSDAQQVVYVSNINDARLCAYRDSMIDYLKNERFKYNLLQKYLKAKNVSEFDMISDSFKGEIIKKSKSHSENNKVVDVVTESGAKYQSQMLISRTFKKWGFSIQRDIYVDFVPKPILTFTYKLSASIEHKTYFSNKVKTSVVEEVADTIKHNKKQVIERWYRNDKLDSSKIWIVETKQN